MVAITKQPVALLGMIAIRPRIVRCAPKGPPPLAPIQPRIASSTDDEGATALLAASRAGNMEAVIALAEAGADVNVADRLGMTPLLYVANRGGDMIYMCDQTGREAARALVQRRANIHACNRRGHTPQMLAKAIGHTEVLDVLNESRIAAR